VLKFYWPPCAGWARGLLFEIFETCFLTFWQVPPWAEFWFRADPAPQTPFADFSRQCLRCFLLGGLLKFDRVAFCVRLDVGTHAIRAGNLPKCQKKQNSKNYAPDGHGVFLQSLAGLARANPPRQICVDALGH